MRNNYALDRKDLYENPEFAILLKGERRKYEVWSAISFLSLDTMVS